ncbi:hypothetical protein POVWA2_031400 [Plasmodium ovale wallikeri]|uniref:Uncharacterized protein n=1 Tax=Plasmodium ovale wallikeri TaxID=864142 RepID=A0A1A8YZ11_PLAOA|nr:hypothetical protein POVWA1_031680 [Plasmodium ovale wallikeri]SBT36690.1 hypothetical protein POVWA2_031400 [Plasmodium ovale wallikeri]
MHVGQGVAGERETGAKKKNEQGSPQYAKTTTPFGSTLLMQRNRQKWKNSNIITPNSSRKRCQGKMLHKANSVND